MLHNICKDRNINIPVDEEYDLVGEAEDDVARREVVRARRAVPLPQAVRRNAARLYRDEFSYLHFNCFLSASMNAHAGAEMVGVDMDAASMDASPDVHKFRAFFFKFLSVVWSARCVACW
ncbi:hypothetical protein GWK47_046766 [Chionoecetes opilio]|uniref:Uncharacterized protein n=1 Tax=Chionoecetes opilio TaxID=41210 RepID=A0A8J4Y650_CHIOP|nr:hypothetical protein GWK47_046766 [Chionoecetes opilio]